MITTRFAPSPTGFVHIGNLRTALYNFLFARKHHGNFILRIEDTDRTRFVPGAIESLLQTLDRLHLSNDEGPVLENGVLKEKGSHGPYIQSERLSIYQKYVDELRKNGHAYDCFCTKERLEELRKYQGAAKQSTKYDRRCLTLSQDEIERKKNTGEPHVIRLKIPDGETTFHDEIRGDITIHNQEIDDQVLLKSDGFPTYHLAVVVDDHLMGVTHVIRGEDWISSMPKHIILYRAFGFPLPVFAHLPLILNPDRSKLSKRQGDVAAEAYLRNGYLAEALLNYITLLGFHPSEDREIYSLDELIETFDLAKINKSGAAFNLEKLQWMNGYYIRQKTATELTNLVRPFLEGEGKQVEQSQLEKICAVEQSRLILLKDIVHQIDVYLETPKMDAELLVWKKADVEDAKKQLLGLQFFFSNLEQDSFASIQLLEEVLKRYIKDNGLQNGNVLWPLRVALSGQRESPSPFELAFALGKSKVLERIENALKTLA